MGSYVTDKRGIKIVTFDRYFCNFFSTRFLVFFCSKLKVGMLYSEPT